MDRSEKTILFIVIGVVAGCLLFSVLCVVVFSFTSKDFVSKEFNPVVPSPAMPTQPVCVMPVQDTTISADADQALLAAAYETEAVLQTASIPMADLNEVATWLYGVSGVPRQIQTEPVQYQIGDVLPFFIMDGDNNSISTNASLRYATENIYFWAEVNIDLDKHELKTLVDTFSNEVYPKTQSFFGSEWIPGVDNDPHLFILYARGLGDSIAGYSSSTDYVLPEVYSYSNAHEMFYINADVVNISDPYTLGTMAHEYQHVILGYQDPDEELWLNEGFSELSSFINGYDTGGFDYVFSSDPDMQLNDWSGDPSVNDVNYGASYLFTTYFLNIFGDSLTREWVSDPLNGLVSLDHFFSVNNIVDPLTGNLYTAEEFFRDWTVANFLNDPDLQGGRYSYANYPGLPQFDVTDWFYNCGGYSQTETVHQFGSDYLQIACDKPVKLTITGNQIINILPDYGENETYFMWSNRADNSDMALTRTFDLTNVSAPVTMNADLWFDLETDFDYGYLLASVNGGDWQVLGADVCPTSFQSSMGTLCTFNGQTDSWQTQSFDLSRFAGQVVSIRFEVVSDGALSDEGFAVDNIEIPEIAYHEDFEGGDGGWVSEGFSRIKNIVPQTFLVTLLSSGSQDPVMKYKINPGEEMELILDPYCFEEDPVLVISGVSRYTRQLADYTITLTR